MRLEDVTAEIRPRLPWESIDLGCALARRHLGSVIKAWSLTVFPMWIVLALLLRNHPILFIICVWWLKPIYDRLPLFVLSRALFGAVPRVGEVVRAWPKLMVSRLWFALIVGRFSPARSLSLPVAELEGLRGKSYRQRVDLLERNGGEGATMATLAGVVLEVVTALGLVMLGMMMVPDEVSTRWGSQIGDFFTYSDFSDIPDAFIWLLAVVQMTAITLMEPFYVSAGFALYINSRTLTEGWDIELAFKRLGARLAEVASKVALIMCGVVAFAGMNPVVMADVEASADYDVGVGTEIEVDVSQESIQQILADEDFTVHHRYVDVPVDEAHPFFDWLADLLSGAALPGFMGILVTIVFYLILAALVAGLVFLIYKNRHIFESLVVKKSVRPGPKITAVMGMDVSPESLPDDVAAAARSAWRDGDYQLALSLLYRGSLVWFVHRADLPIDEGDTEGDCLGHVNQLPDARVVGYFSDLTREWVAVAYGKKVPDDQVMVDLCDHWPFSQNAAKVEKVERRAL